MYEMTQDELINRCVSIAGYLRAHSLLKGYAVPRGGIPAAYSVQRVFFFDLVDNPKEADFFIDDIIDSGKTRDFFQNKFNKPFVALVDKTAEDSELGWIVFPWEGNSIGSIKDVVIRILQYIGEDVSRGGLTETPDRVVRAWEHWFSGYKQKPEDVLKTFEDGAQDYDEMIVVREIPFYSHCEHHIAPFFGTATIAYIPDKKIVGLSKLSRLLDIYAKRLQVQERLTTQIVDALTKHLKPRGAGCIIKARHLCMESRGIEKQGHQTVTSALSGVFKTKPEARAEFMGLLK